MAPRGIGEKKPYFLWEGTPKKGTDGTLCHEACRPVARKLPILV